MSPYHYVANKSRKRRRRHVSLVPVLVRASFPVPIPQLTSVISDRLKNKTRLHNHFDVASFPVFILGTRLHDN